jgi:hypothetical protein
MQLLVNIIAHPAWFGPFYIILWGVLLLWNAIKILCDNIRVSKCFIYQLMHKRTALKRILKFTLKQLLHISVQSPSSGSVLFELAKVTAVTIMHSLMLVIAPTH